MQPTLNTIAPFIRRQEIIPAETLRLLDFSNALSGITDRQHLGLVIRQCMHTMFGLSDYFISLLQADRKTFRCLTHDFSPQEGGTHFFSGTGLLANTMIADAVRLSETPVHRSLPDGQRITGIRLRSANCDLGICYLRAGQLPDTLLQSLAKQLGIALSQLAAYEQLARKSEEHSLLLAFGNAMALATDRPAMATVLQQQLEQLFGIDHFAVHVFSKDKQTHHPVLYPAGLLQKQAQVAADKKLPAGFYEKLDAGGAPVMLASNAWASVEYPGLYAARSLQKIVSLPLYVGRELIGVLNFRYDAAQQWENRKSLCKNICTQIAIVAAKIVAAEKAKQSIPEAIAVAPVQHVAKVLPAKDLGAADPQPAIIGDSLEMKAIHNLVARVATADTTVLLLGETGTGKEVIARAIHQASPRCDEVMVRVNCAALPANLIESELFGHEKGSFTGATERRLGKFELAHNGTLFLDEIGEMPLDLQVKLLRALQEREIERVGGKAPVKVNVRVIAATNRDLQKEVEEGRFRSDLYYRINIFPIALPPLRERVADIPLLAKHFVQIYAQQNDRKIAGISRKVMQDLMRYPWPGNIRELEHLLERSILLSQSDVLTEVQLPVIKQQPPAIKEDVVLLRLDESERRHILAVLQHCQGRVSGRSGASEILGIPATTLTSRMKKLGISRKFTA